MATTEKSFARIAEVAVFPQYHDGRLGLADSRAHVRHLPFGALSIAGSDVVTDSESPFLNCNQGSGIPEERVDVEE
jgi:hypothetical protein